MRHDRQAGFMPARLPRQRRVQTLQQPAIAVSGAFPARAYEPVRGRGGTITLGSYVVAWADPHTLLPNVGVTQRLRETAVDASGGPLACGAASSHTIIVGIRSQGGGI